MKKGKRIRTLEQLDTAARERRSVLLTTRWGTHYRQAAAFVQNWSGHVLVKEFRAGMYLNIPKKPIDPNKPARKFFRKPEPPKPILNLPYYPDL